MILNRFRENRLIGAVAPGIGQIDLCPLANARTTENLEGDDAWVFVENTFARR